MRLTRERLIFHALCVLDEAQDQTRVGAVPASAALRLALAFLHLNGAERGWIDQLWQGLVKRAETGPGADAFGRSQQITASINAISRQVGVERSNEFLDAMRAARRGA